MKFIAEPWLATIILNSVFDILSSLGLYILLQKILPPTSKMPVVAYGVWMLSPLNIIFSVASLPVIVVNFFVIWTILISYLLLRQVTQINSKNSIALSILLGLILGLGNCFRPIFSVALIALLIVYIIMYLTTNRSIRFLKLATVCIALPLVILTGMQKLNIAFVSHEIGLHAAKDPSGVSLFVGSDRKSAGEWRPYINEDMNAICKQDYAQKNYDKCHTELRRAAIKRYKSYGVLNLASLFMRKLYHQAGQQNYFYNAEQSIVGYAGSRAFKFINNYMILYMISLFLLSARFLYILAKRGSSNKIIDPILIFTVLIMIGWFLSFMFVESAPRYSTIIYPEFIIFAMLCISKQLNPYVE
jgi:hypothetical protein